MVRKNKIQEQILRDILLKMNYDSSKTLNENIEEQSVIGAPNSGVFGPTGPHTEPDTSKDDDTIYPIPGYTTYYQPQVGVQPSKGVVPLIPNYFPNNNSVKLREQIALPSDFPGVLESMDEWKRKNPNKSWNYDYLTAEILSRLLPLGTVKSFQWEGKKYNNSILLSKSTDFLWVNNGYMSNDGQRYTSPNPKDYFTWWETVVDKWGTTIQVIGSVLIIIAVEFLTWGGATPFAIRLLLEVVLELGLNIPISIAERSLGDPVGANLSIIFAFLPVLSPNTLRAMGLTGKVTRQLANELSEKVSKAGIKTSEDMAKFYDSLSETPNLQYIFVRVIKQNPEYLAKEIQGIVINTTKKQSYLKKIAFKNKDWWKEAGMQMSAGLTIILWKMMATTTYSEEQYNRMNLLVQSIIDNYSPEIAQEFVSNGIDNLEDMNIVIDSLSIDANTKEGKKRLKTAGNSISNLVKGAITPKEGFKELVQLTLDSLNTTLGGPLDFSDIETDPTIK